jgi:EAL domain-containing protein (putative c-di-GMP-specific phosphodiesterase class I)
MPCAELKLDRSFVLNCSSDRLRRALCQTAVDLAHRVQSPICAEGIDNVDDLRALIAMGCDTAQGFIFAKAMPPAEFVREVIDRPSDFAERLAYCARMAAGAAAPVPASA